MVKNVNCLTCKSIVGAEEISSYIKETTDKEWSQDYNFKGELVQTFEKYIFLKCPCCLNPCVIRFSYSRGRDYAEDYEYTEVLYPKSNTNIDSSVPNSIKNAFNEAMRCFENKAFTASVIMCRKAIEGICKESKIEKKNLRDQLIAMKDQGIIEPSIFEWADALRLSGNDAAHDLDITFSIKDAEDIIEFTHVIIEYIFVYKRKFNLFIERKKNK